MFELFYEKQVESGYSTRTTLRPLTIEGYKRRIVDLTDHTYFGVTTRVVRPWRWWRTLHILALDCDGTNEMLAAAHLLKEAGLGYALIQSSPSHYWLLVDRVDTLPILLALAKSIVGVDSGYLRFVGYNRCFYLRAGPYQGVEKIANISPPLFSAADSLTNQLVIDWYRTFEALWRLPEVVARYRAEVLQRQVTDSTIMSSVADPTFEL